MHFCIGIFFYQKEREENTYDNFLRKRVWRGKRSTVSILTTRATVLNSVALACSFCNYLEA